MAKPEETNASTHLTSAQENLSQLWEDHVRFAFTIADKWVRAAAHARERFQPRQDMTMIGFYPSHCDYDLRVKPALVRANCDT